MRLRTEIGLATGALLGVQVLIAFGATGLLARAGHTAGAWAAVLLGAAGFGLGIVLSRRLILRIERPIGHLADTLIAARRGDRHRRARLAGAPEELTRVAEEVDRLLDLAADRRPPTTPLREAPTDSAALRLLLDERPQPVVVVGPDGELRAANEAAHAVLAAHGDAREALARLPRSGEAPGWRVQPVGRDEGWVCARGAAVEGPEG